MPRNNRDFQNRERWLRQQDADNWGTRRQRRDFERRMRRLHTNTQGLREETAQEVVQERGRQRTFTFEWPNNGRFVAPATFDFDTDLGIEGAEVAEEQEEEDPHAWQEEFFNYVANIGRPNNAYTTWDDLAYKYVKPYIKDREPEEFNAAQYVISVLVKDDREMFTFKQKIASADNANNIFIGTDWWQRMANVADITIGERPQFIAPAFAL